MNNKKFWAGMLVGGIIMMLISIVGVKAFYTLYPNGAGSGNEETADSRTEAIEQKLDLIQSYIEQGYLFDDRYSEEKMEEGIYKGVMESLDDIYSVYYTPDEFTSLMDENNGAYSGIGCYISQNVSTGVLTLTLPMKGSPSEKAGVLPGDILYAVDGVEVTGVDIDTVVTMVKGEEGTQVVLTIAREGVEDFFDITVTRANVEVDTIEYEMLDNQVGYIQIISFDKITVQQFAEALDDLEQRGMEALVLDVRNNPGGDLEAVLDVLEQILPEGPVLSIVDKNGNTVDYETEEKDAVTVPMAVLTDGNSASAAEVFAGAIKDRDAGIIVGTNTFGKGIVQSIIPLGDGSAIKMTTEEFFTPSGNTIHGVGIAPDVEVELDDELKTLTEIPVEDDNQLQAAIAALGK